MKGKSTETKKVKISCSLTQARATALHKVASEKGLTISSHAELIFTKGILQPSLFGLKE